MGIMDFIFQGKPPASVTTTGQTVTGIPTFMSDYTLGLLNRASAVGAELYQPYNNARIAKFTDPQQAAFANVAANQGAFNPSLMKGISTTVGSLDQNAAAAGSPFIQQAGASAPSVMNNYMNPYMDQVTDRLGTLGARNLEEKFMPAIGSQFTRAGQYGSSAMQGAVGRAVRDTQESVQAQQAKALQEGYQSQMAAAQNDLARYGNLGQLSGNLASQTARDQLAAGSQLGSLSVTGQNMNYKDAAALEATGQTQQVQNQKNYDLAYQDFLEQRNYPNQQLSMMNSLVRGLPYTVQQNTTSYGPGSVYQPSPLSQVAGGASLVKALQGMTGMAEGGEVDVVNAAAERQKQADLELSKVKFSIGGLTGRKKNRRSTRGRGR